MSSFGMPRHHTQTDMMIFKQNMQLSNLTGNLEPKLLLQEMIQLSE